jgi:hypothetical protein
VKFSVLGVMMPVTSGLILRKSEISVVRPASPTTIPP